MPIGGFIESVAEWGDGLYVVGLDIHTGFIAVEENDVFFIHASYLLPYCVVRERAHRSRILSSSKYRVLGKISDDDALLRKWLTSEKIATRTGA